MLHAGFKFESRQLLMNQCQGPYNEYHWHEDCPHMAINNDVENLNFSVAHY